MSSTYDRQAKRLEDIGLILKDLLKAIKVVSMYPEDNPLPQSLKRTVAERLVELVESYGTIDIYVVKDSLYCENEVVFEDRSKEERLAGMFFDTGITRFAFNEGLDVEEIYKLLDVFKEYLNASDREGDLISSIWEAEISRFTFETIEDVALVEYDGDFSVQEMLQDRPLPDAGSQLFGSEAPLNYETLFTEELPDSDSSPQFDENDNAVGVVYAVSGAAKPTAGHAGGDAPIIGTVLSSGSDTEDAHLKLNEAVEAMGLADLTDSAPRLPDTAMILNTELKLSEEDEEQANHLVVDDAEFDIYESTTELLKEMLHQEPELSDFSETVTICEKVINELIKAGKLTYAGDLLRYFHSLQDQLHGKRPLWAERLHEALVTAGSRNRMGVLSDTLNQNENLGTLELRSYLDNFGWEALMGISEMLGEVLHDSHREAISNYLAERGKTNLPLIANGIYDKRKEVVLASITALALIGNEQALVYLEKAVEHNDPEIRANLVEALQICPNDKALELLRVFINDSNGPIRKAAVKAIVARRGQSAFETIAEIIGNEGFPQLDRDDQLAIFNAYSVLGGDMAVDFLARLIRKFNPFRFREVAFYRQAAFEALSLNRSERCERLLVRLQSNWRRGIKMQAAATLKARREKMFGGSDD